MDDHDFFRTVQLVALLLFLLPLVLPLARSGRRTLRLAAAWVLIGGFAVALFLLGEWLLT